MPVVRSTTASNAFGFVDVIVNGVLESDARGPLGPERLHQFCEQRLAPHLRPARFVWSAIPKTATGKVRKDLLVLQMSEGAA